MAEGVVTMKPLTPRARLKWLRAELRHAQTQNRSDVMLLKMGIAKAKRLGAEMRAAQGEIAKGKTAIRNPGGNLPE